MDLQANSGSKCQNEAIKSTFGCFSGCRTAETDTRRYFLERHKGDVCLRLLVYHSNHNNFCDSAYYPKYHESSSIRLLFWLPAIPRNPQVSVRAGPPSGGPQPASMLWYLPFVRDRGGWTGRGASWKGLHRSAV